MQQLRARQDCAGFPDRGAEDREEGAEGDGDEDCWQEMSGVDAWFCGDAHGMSVDATLRCALGLLYGYEFRCGTPRTSRMFIEG